MLRELNLKLQQKIKMEKTNLGENPKGIIWQKIKNNNM